MNKILDFRSLEFYPLADDVGAVIAYSDISDADLEDDPLTFEFLHNVSFVRKVSTPNGKNEAFELTGFYNLSGGSPFSNPMITFYVSLDGEILTRIPGAEPDRKLTLKFAFFKDQE